MIVGLFPNMIKHQSKNIAIGIREFLSTQGVKVVAEDGVAETIGASPLSEIDVREINFSISLGGDGTILRLMHRHPEIEAPIVGVNLGSLGFMADIPLDDIYPSLHDLLNGAYKVQERVMMEGITASGQTCRAVNDIVVHRAQNPCLVELAIHVDGNYLNTFSADGIIIATANGSTAYSLAAGGPILTPDLEAFVLTPICPHTISNRPIVLMPQQMIQVQYISEYQPVEITYDGFSSMTIGTGEVFNISRSSRKFKLVTLLRHEYFSTLRTKLNWAGKLKT